MQIKIEARNVKIAGDRPQVFVIDETDNLPPCELVVGPHENGQIIVWRLGDHFSDETGHGVVVEFQEGMRPRQLLEELEYADYVFAKPSLEMARIYLAAETASNYAELNGGGFLEI